MTKVDSEFEIFGDGRLDLLGKNGKILNLEVRKRIESTEKNVPDTYLTIRNSIILENRELTQYFVNEIYPALPEEISNSISLLKNGESKFKQTTVVKTHGTFKNSASFRHSFTLEWFKPSLIGLINPKMLAFELSLKENMEYRGGSAEKRKVTDIDILCNIFDSNEGCYVFGQENTKKEQPEQINKQYESEIVLCPTCVVEFSYVIDSALLLKESYKIDLHHGDNIIKFNILNQQHDKYGCNDWPYQIISQDKETPGSLIITEFYFRYDTLAALRVDGMKKILF